MSEFVVSIYSALRKTVGNTSTSRRDELIYQFRVHMVVTNKHRWTLQLALCNVIISIYVIICVYLSFYLSICLSIYLCICICVLPILFCHSWVLIEVASLLKFIAQTLPILGFMQHGHHDTHQHVHHGDLNGSIGKIGDQRFWHRQSQGHGMPSTLSEDDHKWWNCVRIWICMYIDVYIYICMYVCLYVRSGQVRSCNVM